MSGDVVAASGERRASADLAGSTVRCVLFDLGGLLIEFRGVDAIGDWLGGDRSQELWERWLASPAVRAFERGASRADAFARDLVTEFGLDLEPDTVLEEIAGWISDPVAGAVALLDELRALGPARPRLACLSNTNAVHWPLLAGAFGDRFDDLFLSHQTGRVKPDPGSFDQVPERLGIDPAAVLFFDDQPTNVEAALRRGLDAVQARTPAECRGALVERGLLAAAPPAPVAQLDPAGAAP